MILKRIAFRSLIAILVIVSCITSTLVVATAAPANEAKPSNGVTDLAIKTSKDKNSYTTYISKYSKSEYSSEDVIYDLNGQVLKDKPIEFTVHVEKDGLYYIGMTYKSISETLDNALIGLKIDGKYLYSNMEKLVFPRMWRDKDGVNVDALGNEYHPEQEIYNDYYYNEAFDISLEATEKFMVNLTKGEHKVVLLPVKANIKLKNFKFAATVPLEKYSAPTDKSKYYDGEAIIIEGEDTLAKSSYFLVGGSENSSINVTPNNVEKRLINYIGTNWTTVGDTIIWETPELEAGYYQLGFSFRQNEVIGSKSYRSLKINGKSPFLEADSVGFKFGDAWQTGVFADENQNPYLVYLENGVNRISLTVTASEMSLVRSQLTEAVAEMGDLYVDMTKITGENVDVFRDYELFRQIGDMEERLLNIKALLENSAKTLLEITGETTGSNYSIIQNMLRVIGQMLDYKSEAHKFKSGYYNNYCSISSLLSELRKMPLQLDKISLTAPNAEPFEEASFFASLVHSVKRFIWSFIDEYSIADFDDDKSITIWVNWGRDQTQILSALIERKFTPQTGIKVNLKLVNASIIQAVLSGKGPDLVLQQGRTEPVNLAMRGVLYDLTNFKDYKEVLQRFQKGADTPYWYNGGLYGIPDTQSFNVMFYRKDIIAEYGIEIPETWEEFQLATKLLMRNNMNVCMPASTSTVSMFPTLLLQNGYNLYTEDGRSTTLLSSNSSEIFEQWTNYYTKLKVPISMDFYNRFRTGTTPLGIAAYPLYTTLKVAAPEIDGLWGFTTIPGTVQEDGTVNHTDGGAGTACSILNMAADNGREDEAWEFLKWWTSADIQLSYSNDVETVLGPSGRVAVSNKKALESLSWDEGALEALVEARNWVTEIPEYPGSYYVSRAIYQAFWNVVSSNKNTKDMMMKYGAEANNEIARKWEQYTNRG